MGNLAQLLVCSTVVGALALGGAVGAAPLGKRTAVKTYDRPAAAIAVSTVLGTSDGAGYCDPGAGAPADGGCVRFSFKRGDKTYSVRIQDALGFPVGGLVVNTNGRIEAHFCGATEKPLPVTTAWIDVWAVAGTCPDATTPSTPSTGKVRATITR